MRQNCPETDVGTQDVRYTDSAWAKNALPYRPADANKGDFGRLLVLTGSRLFPGAAALSLEGALRLGVGYVTYSGGKDLVGKLVQKFPEVLYRPYTGNDEPTEGDVAEICAFSAKQNATLIGCGCGHTECTLRLVRALLQVPNSPLILDADALNAVASAGTDLLREAARPLILTPHPLEFSRLSGWNVDYIQANRIECATKFAAEYNCTLVLKGAGTVVTDGCRTYVNTTGSSALAKAGSGDVLAGALSALTAYMKDRAAAAALAVYLHGAAADALEKEYSAFGVIPSDLPKEIGRQIVVLGQK